MKFGSATVGAGGDEFETEKSVECRQHCGYFLRFR